MRKLDVALSFLGNHFRAITGELTIFLFFLEEIFKDQLSRDLQFTFSSSQFN